MPMTGIPVRRVRLASRDASPPDAAERDVSRPAGFYVSVRTSARMAESALVLGPFPDRGSAADHIPAVRRFVAERHRGREWWRFGTRLVTARPGQALPLGTLNRDLGVLGVCDGSP